MSIFKNFSFFKKVTDTYSNEHGIITEEDRSWEEGYRKRWSYDKIVRSTHGVNCTGSCSWKVYVKKGVVVWETQQTDYPETRADLPNHEPRGCPRGASYSWYLYSTNRLKYPLIRGELLKLWRKAKEIHSDPVEAWRSIQESPDKVDSYQKARGMGGHVRSNWNEVNEIIAASNIYTTKKWGPDRIVGFSPIPAMSMVSYSAGSRYLSLIGGACLSFYDWYCDLPPSSPQIWGEQTDVPEAADWYNAGYIMMWGSNVPLTRTPDAHFMTEARYKGTKISVVSPDYNEAARFADNWLNPKQGTDAALALAMGHVILSEYHVGNKKSDYFQSYIRKYSDMPFLVKLKQTPQGLVTEKMLRASDLKDNFKQSNNPEWKTLVINELNNELTIPKGTIGSRWNEQGQWNLTDKDVNNNDLKPKLSLLSEEGSEIQNVLFPYLANINRNHKFMGTDHPDVIAHKIPVKTIKGKDGDILVATVYDLTLAHYGVNRGLDDQYCAKSYDENLPFTPKWQEQITGVDKTTVINIAREFAKNAHDTNGKSLVIIGAGVNHWYNTDMIYRSIINNLIFCGCVGQSGGGWAHYVGQEKLRPQTGWLPLAFALDWNRPPRQMNSTSFFYSHTNQWRYETVKPTAMLSPLAQKEKWENLSLLDCNVKAERLGWLPSAPQLSKNPLEIAEDIKASNLEAKDYIALKLKQNEISFASEDPDSPNNFPRNMFVWRSNILGSSAKGHEYFLKHLLGTDSGIIYANTIEKPEDKPSEVKWHEQSPKGKLDLLVTLDFRMSTTCVYSDIVLPTASWYEKNDLNTSDMHPFIHPLCKAVDPVWESKSDWEIFKGIAKEFTKLSTGHLGKQEDVVLTPIMHDTPLEIAQTEVTDWKYNECEPIAGKTMPNVSIVERDYNNIYQRFITLGDKVEKLGNGGKGIAWQTQEEMTYLKKLNGTVKHNPNDEFNDLVKIETDIDATNVILALAPETNGEVAVKSWDALSKVTGMELRHLAESSEHTKMQFSDLKVSPRKIISSPTWSGIESEDVSYTSNYTNVNEYIPWRTLTGRQQTYQDHQWMLDFGEGLVTYKAPIILQEINAQTQRAVRDNGNQTITLNFLTPHQKWGIHSTYSDNLIMLTLSRGGPCIWLSEDDARSVNIADNDWIEAWNNHGTITARAIVSQRIPTGMTIMYHAQEKIVNLPISEITEKRGGIHNSVSRIVLKPTHMIGGYVQLSYGFNYYGTIGSNRDNFVTLRKMNKARL